MVAARLQESAAFRALSAKLDAGATVLADGGVASQVIEGQIPEGDAGWSGSRELYESQTAVLELYRGCVEAGCDVVSINSWPVLRALAAWEGPESTAAWDGAVDAALRLARAAVDDAGRGQETAVAFPVGGIPARRAEGVLRLLARRWKEGPAPDLVVLEAVPELPMQHTLAALRTFSEVGVPVWVSLQRRSYGMVNTAGDLWRGEAPDAMAQAASDLGAAGARALLLDCVPLDLAPQAIADLRAATQLPVGCMPNHSMRRGDPRAHGVELEPEAFALAMLDWLDEGAQIVGACCGATAAHLGAARKVLDSAVAWSARGV